MSTQPPSGSRRVWQTPPPLTVNQRHLVIRSAQAHSVTWLERRIPDGRKVTADLAAEVEAALRHHPPIWPDLHDAIENRFRDNGFTNPATRLAMASADTYILALDTFKTCVEFALDQLVAQAATPATPPGPPGRQGTLAKALGRRRHGKALDDRADSQVDGAALLRTGP